MTAPRVPRRCGRARRRCGSDRCRCAGRAGLQHGVRRARPARPGTRRWPARPGWRPMAERSGLIQVDRASTTGTRPKAGSSQMDGAQPGTEQAGQGHGGQRDRENRHRAEQHQPQDRVRGDDLRLQRRVDPRVVADGDGDAGNQGRDGDEHPHTPGVARRGRAGLQRPAALRCSGLPPYPHCRPGGPEKFHLTGLVFRRPPQFAPWQAAVSGSWRQDRLRQRAHGLRSSVTAPPNLAHLGQQTSANRARARQGIRVVGAYTCWACTGPATGARKAIWPAEQRPRPGCRGRMRPAG